MDELEGPAQNVEAEQSVLGAMLLSREAISEVSELLTGMDFYRPAHDTIYRTILTMHSKGEPVDPITVMATLTRESEITRVGGPAYLHQLSQAVPSASSASYYADIVSRAAMLRRLDQAGKHISQLARSGGDEVELVEAARKAVDGTSKATTTPVLSFGDTIDRTIDELSEKPNQVPTPWNALNDIIGGLRPGGLYVVAARPSVGKSVIALQLARSLTDNGSVAFSSLEMSESDVQIRAVAMDLQINLGRLIERRLTDNDWAKIRNRRAAWQDVPLFVDDRSGVTITDIKRFARSVHRRKPLAGIVVDYLQLMAQAPGDKRPRQEFVADMSRQLKILAMEMKVPVIALSQLNRGSTQREDKMPQISDMRESGAIEQDADVVMLLHREIMGENKGDLALLVAKNRNGSTNIAELSFWGHYSMALDKGSPLPGGQ
ncbi:replicative DNA helicase [Pseudarthrobacter sp. NamE5]|uniref:replicative DNA helicase n=1 Tax=Pseudarthrobacter sp. NamE5 TaxID=2576839 RepID=UPI0014864247|nr:replicative DNA helicase [Pseudarthrobacter sp. NamE5]